MPEITLPEVKLPDVKLPDGFRECRRTTSLSAVREVKLPKNHQDARRRPVRHRPSGRDHRCRMPGRAAPEPAGADRRADGRRDADRRGLVARHLVDDDGAPDPAARSTT